MKILYLSLTAFFLLCLSACGGGGGGGSSSTATPSNTAPGASTTTSYTAGAQIGELVSFSVTNDASGNPASYSYVITKSAFGCEVASATCHTGSGTLALNSDGTYTPSQFPQSRLRILANGLLFGAIQVPVNGVNTTVPIVGMQNPATSLSDFADAGGTIYNWTEFVCTTPGGVGGSCSTKIGTARVNPDGTFYSCNGYNLADTGTGVNSGNSTNCPTSPYTANTSNGKMVSNGDGTWAIQTTNYAAQNTYYNVGTFIAFRDPTTGQRVAIFDIQDKTYGGNGWGYGQIIAASQSAITMAQGAGTWVGNQYWTNSTPHNQFVKSVMTNPSNSATTLTMNGTSSSSSGSNAYSGTLLGNSVNIHGSAGAWNGFASPSTDASEVDLLAGNGFYMGVSGLTVNGTAYPSRIMVSTGFKLQQPVT